MISSFEFSCPAKISFGAHAFYHLPFDLACMDAGKAFVIADKKSCESNLAQKLSDAFRDSDTVLGFAILTEDDYSDPALIEKLYSLSAENGYDSIIVSGTGKTVQIAKLLNIAISFGPEFLRHFKENINCHLPASLRPLVFIPSIPIEVEQSFTEIIFQNSSFVSPFFMPDLIVIFPDIMLNPPDDMIINLGLASFAVCGEAFVFSDNPLARPYADLGIRLIMESLDPLLRDNDKGKVIYGKAAKKNRLALAKFIHATVISGFMISNIPDMKTINKTTGQDMVSELLNIFEGTDSPWLSKLLLPLTDPEQYSAASESLRPELTIYTIQEFINKIQDARYLK